jgi:hypothetical protein
MNALSTSLRLSSRRRLRRRTQADGLRPLYCGTNGCTSFLELDSGGTVARCHICGYTRRIRTAR